MYILCIYMHISSFMNVASDQMYSISFYLSSPRTPSIFITALPFVHTAKSFPPWHQSSPCLQFCLFLKGNLQWSASIHFFSQAGYNVENVLFYCDFFFFFLLCPLLCYSWGTIFSWCMREQGEFALPTTEHCWSVRGKGIAGIHPTTLFRSKDASLLAWFGSSFISANFHPSND